ncbi:hypothetical protein FIA58_000215 [Flavobacterium jejuense]|uniref:Uncharacterized protein n=1 Tax=Flavobacterium jejuense TaxID=1544455 RepID=A0ABX0IM40_9FLAO|nr:hypothetical protein [Flavobacterium jejuense]NHN24085.1 hypothetical protein [Flavobacterium jejuense]
MKNIPIQTILQSIALLFLVIIGYFMFTASSNWQVVTTELEKAKEELKFATDSILATKVQLEKTKQEFQQMKVQKDFLIHTRDSLILSFKRNNAKDWEDLQKIKDSIVLTNEKLDKDRLLLDGLFGLHQ